ncbi:MAG: hypothetical protein M3Z33_09825 [Actinomycetota bacterium]|nr:hypothetical protein [Actinomycetota bacterium]
MNELLTRLSALFVTPAPQARPVTCSMPAPSVALLCSPADALAAGALLALDLARTHQVGTALLCLWRAGERAVPAWSAPALRGPRRALAALTAHDLEAEAGGRLVRLRLPEEPEAAFAVATRAAAVCAIPAVSALAGPRTPALDQLLIAQDLVVVAHRPDADPALPELACRGLTSLRVPTIACPVAPGARGRAFAAAGIATPAARSVFAPAIEALT